MLYIGIQYFGGRGSGGGKRSGGGSGGAASKSKASSAKAPIEKVNSRTSPQKRESAINDALKSSVSAGVGNSMYNPNEGKITSAIDGFERGTIITSGGIGYKKTSTGWIARSPVVEVHNRKRSTLAAKGQKVSSSFIAKRAMQHGRITYTGKY